MHDAYSSETIRRQRDRIEELEEEVRQLRELVAPRVHWAPGLGLSPLDKKVLSVLIAKSPAPVTRDRIMAAVYPDPDSAAGPKTIDTVICRVRKRLAHHGVHIGSAGYFSGWYIDRENAAILAGLQVKEATSP